MLKSLSSRKKKDSFKSEPTIEDFFHDSQSKLKQTAEPKGNGGHHDIRETNGSSPSEEHKEWTNEQTFFGQLSVDVYHRNGSLIVKAPLAGVRPENIEITLNHDLLTIKGFRNQEEAVNEEEYFYRECYFGGFSRSIILPSEAIAEKVKAIFDNGMLTIVLPLAKQTPITTIPVSS